MPDGIQTDEHGNRVGPVSDGDVVLLRAVRYEDVVIETDSAGAPIVVLIDDSDIVGIVEVQ